MQQEYLEYSTDHHAEPSHVIADGLPCALGATFHTAGTVHLVHSPSTVPSTRKALSKYFLNNLRGKQWPAHSQFENHSINVLWLLRQTVVQQTWWLKTTHVHFPDFVGHESRLA